MRLSPARALLIAASLIAGSMAAAEEQPSAAQMMDDLMFGRDKVGGPFTLTDISGRQRSDTRGDVTPVPVLLDATAVGVMN